jgi:DNA mismatch endonuclease, patch repair protein
MSALKTSGTRPELALRRELHARGLRYRVNVADLPGRPDLVLSRARIVVFVDGCFWHGCPQHAVPPKANANWWRDKLAGNVARDQRNSATLTHDGWLVVRIWEHEDLPSAAARIESLWRERTGRVPF